MTTKGTKASVTALAARVGYAFHKPTLLELALTHSSLAFEAGRPQADNEQLEFVGDAVLGLLVAESLYRRFPALGEGELTRMRALLVSRKHMGEVGARLALGDHLRLGRGEEQSGGRKKPALLANAMEAVLAAVYLDGGLEAVRSIVEREIVEPRLPQLERAAGEQTHFGGVVGDYKSALQELLQAKKSSAVAKYIVTEESGPDHRKFFRVELRLHEDGAERLLATGAGATKKAAQQQAAETAFLALRDATSQEPSRGKAKG
jgi:ribonuclease-3